MGELVDDVEPAVLAAIMRTILDEVVRPDVRFASLGVDVPAPEQRTPNALKQLVESEFNKWLPLVQSAQNSAKK